VLSNIKIYELERKPVAYLLLSGEPEKIASCRIRLFYNGISKHDAV